MAAESDTTRTEDFSSIGEPEEGESEVIFNRDVDEDDKEPAPPERHISQPTQKGPIVVFINGRSGGQQGPGLLKAFRELLPPDQVFDLSEGGPGPGLLKWKDVPGVRVIACGGDGTVGWVLGEMDKIEYTTEPPAVSTLPLGTANDLSRTFKWGHGYTNESLTHFLEQIDRAKVIRMDRWKVQIEPLSEEQRRDPRLIKKEIAIREKFGTDLSNPSPALERELRELERLKAKLEKKKDKAPSKDEIHQKTIVMNNYFSFGTDAEIALSFHRKREAKPGIFKSRLFNKMSYGALSLGAGLTPHSEYAGSLRNVLEVELDGQRLDIPKRAKAVVVLNLLSYAAGNDLWGPSQLGDNPRFAAQTVDDKLFEVVALAGVMHLGSIQAGLSRGLRLGQGRTIKFTNHVSLPAQVDGEPWMQGPTVTTITHHNQARMLLNIERLKAKKRIAKKITTDGEVLDRPLVVLVNPKSGGQDGAELLAKLRNVLGPHQVYDIVKEGGPAKPLQLYAGEKDLRVVVAGGDGTVGWVLSEMDKLGYSARKWGYPPLAILPVGTGNDFARSFKWGAGYDGDDVVPMLKAVEKAPVAKVDRWTVAISPTDPAAPAKSLVMNNYFSLGVDAQVALQFHLDREAHPKQFTSRTHNKMVYVGHSLKAIVSHPTPLERLIDVDVDGQKTALPRNLGALIVLNLPSYAAGTDLWGPSKRKDDKFQPPAVDDCMLEVVGVKGVFELGAIQINLSHGKRIAQGRDIKITIKQEVAAQLDGEPWMQQPATLQISFLNQAVVCYNTSTTKSFCRKPARFVKSPQLNDRQEDTATATTSSPPPAGTTTSMATGESIPAPSEQHPKEPADTPTKDASTGEATNA